MVEDTSLTIFKLLISLSRSLLQAVSRIPRSIRLFYFRKTYKPPMTPDAAKKLAVMLLGGQVYEAVAFTNAGSKKKYIAAYHKNHDSADNPRIAILEETGRSYAYFGCSPAVFHAKDLNIIDLDKDGIHEVSFVDESFGASGEYGSITIFVYRLRDRILYEISEGHEPLSRTGQKAPKIYPKGFDNHIYYDLVKAFAADEGYLKIPDIDYDDPKNAIAAWLYDNGDVEWGTIKLRKYLGQPKIGGNSLAVVEENFGIRWISAFKGALYGYIQSSNQHFVVIPAIDSHAWVKRICFVGQYMIFSRHTGNGFFLFKTIDETSGRLSKIEHYRGKGLPQIEKLIVNGNILIINDEFKMDMKEILQSLG